MGHAGSAPTDMWWRPEVKMLLDSLRQHRTSNIGRTPGRGEAAAARAVRLDGDGCFGGVRDDGAYFLWHAGVLLVVEPGQTDVVMSTWEHPWRAASGQGWKVPAGSWT